MRKEVIEVKTKSGRYIRTSSLRLEISDERIIARFGFNRSLITEVKSMKGSKWHGFEGENKKYWSFENCKRNWFQLERLKGGNPYARYDGDNQSFTPTRDCLREHQIDMYNHGRTRHYCIWACEMGTGKTLPSIEIMEQARRDNPDAQIWYVGPKSGVMAVNRELLKWDCAINPHMYTYEGMVKAVKNWQQGAKAPVCVIFDEASKLKTPNSQRTQAANYVAEAVLEEWGDDGYIIEMTGTPAPKSPDDWWSLTEVACPGFLKEGSKALLKTNLCISEPGENDTGGFWTKLITWLDDEKKCVKCGLYEDDIAHKYDDFILSQECEFEPSKNEVARLHKRLAGLVLVKFKKDCLDLPEKQYEVVHVKPTVETLRAARLIKSTVPQAAQVITLLRELSDGFQYVEAKTGESSECPVCKGKGEHMAKVPKPDLSDEELMEVTADLYTDELITCDNCAGTGELAVYAREASTVSCPKDIELIRALSESEEEGRLVVWGGFTGTIDRLTASCLQQGWAVLQVDGRGYNVYTPNSEESEVATSDEFLSCLDASTKNYRELRDKWPRVVFVGHPQAGGMALTLTASPLALYYSNCFSGEARMQSEDRTHRMGMALNKGCTIRDLIHLPTDQLVLDNLKQKKRLQDLTLGEIEGAFNQGAHDE